MRQRRQRSCTPACLPGAQEALPSLPTETSKVTCGPSRADCIAYRGTEDCYLFSSVSKKEGKGGHTHVSCGRHVWFKAGASMGGSHWDWAKVVIQFILGCIIIGLLDSEMRILKQASKSKQFDHSRTIYFSKKRQFTLVQAGRVVYYWHQWIFKMFQKESYLQLHFLGQEFSGIVKLW